MRLLACLSCLAAFAAEPPLVVGHGALRYALDLKWAKADPAVAPIVNAHALAEDKAGRIYLVTDHPKNDFIVFEKDGRYVRSISAGLGGGHGLEIFEKDGVEYLVHVDSGWHMAAEGWNPSAVEGRITLLTTDGKVVRKFPTPKELGLADGKFMPCDVAWTPAGTLLVADGYGSNFIYEFSLEGKLLKKWGGPTKDAANLSNAHGISIDVTDPRGPLVWVPSRSQNQLKAFTLDGKHVDTLDLRHYVVERLSGGARIDYLICDEAQFYTEEQVDQLAAIVDELEIDVYAFGIMTDFRTRLFPGSARLVELSDRVQVLQVEALCWCGARAIHNARTVNGQMVVEGDQVVVGDVAGSSGAGQVAYEVLCRRHYRSRRTVAVAGTEHMSREPLPFSSQP